MLGVMFGYVVMGGVTCVIDVIRGVFGWVVLGVVMVRINGNFSGCFG